MKHASKALVMLATVMLLACLTPCLALAQPSEQAGAVTEPALVGGGASAALEAQDATTFTVGLQVTYSQTEAREMLDSVNAFRKGSDAWYWNETDTEKVQCTGLGNLAYDYDLERIAKYRAAEIALSYSHTTLDGTSPVWPRMTGRTAKGENIAAGYTTAAAVFEGWQETNNPYSGQGHRRNMLSANFTAVGIGHVVCNGYHYWVQELAAPTSNAAATDADDSTSTVDLQIADSVITARNASVSTDALKLGVGESAGLPDVTVKIATADTWPKSLQQAGVQVSIPGSPSIVWSSSNPSVAKVTNGSVEAVAVGTATLTAAVPLGSIDSPTVAVTVVDASQAAYAILYENGDLVFQRGPTPEATRGTVVQTWTGFEAGEKASENMWGADDYRKQVKKIVFKDKLAPVGSMAGFFNKLENAASVEGASNLNTSKVTDMSSMFSGCSSLASLDLSSWDTSKVTDMRYMFSECSLLASLGISGWDTSSVASMAYMFSGCSSLTSLDLSDWNTSAATGMYAMSCMFQNCSLLKTLGVSNWDTSKATYMRNMFSGCSSLETLDVSKWNTSNVTSMYSMFSGCSKLTSLDVSKWNTSKVTDMNYMFSACLSLTSLNVSGWNTSNVTLMRQMFQYCSSLTVLDFSSWDTSKVTVMVSMFYGCSKLASFNFGPAFKFVDTNVALPDITETDAYTGKWERSSDKATATSAELMARSDLEGTWTWQKKAQGADIASGTWGTCPWTIDANGVLTVGAGTGADNTDYSSPWADYGDKVTEVRFAPEGGKVVFPANSSYLFYGLSCVTAMDLKNVDVSGVTSMNSMFFGCSKLTSLDVSKWDTSKVTSLFGMFYGCSSLSSLDVSKWDTSAVTDMISMFYGCSSLSSLDVSKWDTSKVRRMSGLFSGCSSLSALDVSKWDTSKVTQIGGMFSGCSSLSTLDVSGWDTSNVMVMSSMFYGCSSLTTLDVSKWDTSSVKGVGEMFRGCSSLSSLDVSGWDTSSVEDVGDMAMMSMFYGCSSLSSLDVSKWDTSKVTFMGGMFEGCSSLSSLDVSGWDTSKVTNMGGMFGGCSKLASLDLSGWDTSSVTYMHEMFSGCSKLASLNFGSAFGFVESEFGNAALPDVAETDAYTGKWERSSDKATATSAELMVRSDLEGAWTWQKKAQDEPARSGTFGTCDWSIDEAGKLVIEPSNGVSGVLPSNDGQDSEFFPWVKAASLVKSAEIRKGVSLEGSAKRMFGNCSNLKSIDASGFDTSKVTSMELMFASCTSLSSLDLSSWDTSSVTTMRSLFGGCRSLASVNLSGWDTSHVIDMEGMFAACASLASLDLSGFDMSANKGIGGMLSECSALSTLKLGESVMLHSSNGVKYAGLPDAPSTSPYTGKWARVSDGMSVTSYELQHRAGAELAGTWVWETESGGSDDPGGSGQGGQQGGEQGGEPSDGSGGSVSPGDNPGGPSTDPSGSSVDPGGSGQGGSTPSKPDLKQYEGTAAASGMSDLKAGEWFMDPATGAFPGTSTLYIDYTIARGLMGGYKDGSGRVTAFGPHDPLSRAQTATILYRLAKPDSKATTEPAAYEDNESGLTDVASRQYYTAAVNWCVKEGIITGYKNAQGKYTTFGPDDSVSREQLATMIFRYCTKYAKRDADTADITSFSDYGKINDWARDGVAYCVANKIVGGYTDGSGRFGPQDSAERCQMSKIIAVTAYMLE